MRTPEQIATIRACSEGWPSDVPCSLSAPDGGGVSVGGEAVSEHIEAAHEDGERMFGRGFLFGFVMGALVLLLAEQWSRQQKLDACARQHNVYACHMVAVPAEKEDAR